MKFAGRIVAFLLFLPALSVSAAPDYSPSHFDQFLRSCVQKGRVHFSRANENRKLLEDYLSGAGKLPKKEFESWPREERIAFLINVFNALTIKSVLDHYPVADLRNLAGAERYPLLGESLTLGQIEEKFLLDTYRDERICLVLYRAAKSGPPINRVYRASDLDRSLDRDTRYFVNGSRYNRIRPGKRKVYLSSLFKWHAGRFLLNYGGAPSENAEESAVLSFVADYADETKKEYLKAGRYKVKYLPFDWSLDE